MSWAGNIRLHLFYSSWPYNVSGQDIISKLNNRKIFSFKFIFSYNFRLVKIRLSNVTDEY